jgi:hypothetical protein
MNAIKSIIKNWLTSTIGTITGAPIIYEGIMQRNWKMVAAGIGALLLGLASKDANVTGGTVKQ